MYIQYMFYGYAMYAFSCYQVYVTCNNAYILREHTYYKHVGASC